MIKRRYFYACERDHQDSRGKSTICGAFHIVSLFAMDESELFRRVIGFAEESELFQNKPSDKPIFITALNRI